jgi:cytochrome P450
MTRSPESWSQKVQQRLTKHASVLLTPDIYQRYQALQTSSQRVLFDHERESWLVFRYADVHRVLLDTSTFSSQRAFKPDGSVDTIAGGGILGMDPPRHQQIRALASQAFTPRMVALLEPRILSLTQILLDQVEGTGEMDVVDDLAFPLPILVIAELLGVPSADRELFRQWSANTVGTDYALRLTTGKQMAQYFQALLERRRHDPREDLMSAFLSAEVDGEQLPDQDIVGTCMLLLVAGHETTTGLLSNAVVCLDEHPLARQEVMQHPDLLPQTIEEVLRYRAIVHTIPRVATVETLLGDQQVQEGDLVLPLFAAANLDEAQFPNANHFDIHRTPNRHLGFGYGIHFCLGAPLARLETRIALRLLLERFPQIQRRRDIPLELKPNPAIYGLKHVPVTLR